MSETAKPFLAIYVVWHPEFHSGPEMAEAVRKHFRRGTFDVSGYMGVSVVYRFTPLSNSKLPSDIDFDEAKTTAIVALIDSNLAGDESWAQYIRDLGEQAEFSGLGTRLFPVSIEKEAIAQLELSEQALRWDKWNGSVIARQQHLISELTYAFCRMLRHYLEHLKRPSAEEMELERYLAKVQVFLSHSKHDEDGEQIAEAIRNRIHKRHDLASFFDVYNIPVGLRFPKVLIQQVRVSAVVAIHTDSFSSREWCRREVIETKLRNRPLVVANCISNLDERSFPYMGNVPVVSVDYNDQERIDFLIGRLLDEVLKDFLWCCQIEMYSSKSGSGVIFLPRPPELISLAGLPQNDGRVGPVIVYPDPPVGKEEENLFARVAPQVRLASLMEWTAETFQ